jgi:two-component system, OmpR family, sensor histidine kinase QseC
MIHSIRRFLLFYLLLSITIISSLTVMGDYFLNHRDIQRYFDSHLKQTMDFLIAPLERFQSRQDFKKIQTLINKQQKPPHDADTDDETISTMTGKFEFQIWDSQGNLILHSKHTSHEHLSNTDGFSDKKTKDKTWRVYSQYYEPLELTVQVAEVYNFRQSLEQRIVWNNLIILIWTYLALSILIWLTVGYGLGSLKKLKQKLSSQAITNFEPIKVNDFPIEIRPLVAELNKLFLRLQLAFERNKRFAADAAHELRTPLAALKTQAQVALLAATDEERKKIIQKTIIGANRCTHLVQQLLTLSRLGEEATLDDIKSVNLIKLSTEMMAQLAPGALEKDIDIELLESKKKNINIYGNETALSILMRNLIDNAIRYTPEKGEVKVAIIDKKNQVVFQVTDSGHGIPPELHSRVFERFYRALGTKASGSGLGLPIVRQIADLHHATIKLSAPKKGTGLIIEVIFPKGNKK